MGAYLCMVGCVMCVGERTIFDYRACNGKEWARRILYPGGSTRLSRHTVRDGLGQESKKRATAHRRKECTVTQVLFGHSTAAHSNGAEGQPLLGRRRLNGGQGLAPEPDALQRSVWAWLGVHRVMDCIRMVLEDAAIRDCIWTVLEHAYVWAISGCWRDRFVAHNLM